MVTNTPNDDDEPPPNIPPFITPPLQHPHQLITEVTHNCHVKVGCTARIRPSDSAASWNEEFVGISIVTLHIYPSFFHIKYLLV